MGAGEIEGLGGGDAGDQAIRDLGSGRQGRRMPGAAQKQITVDFIGNQNQIAFGAEEGEGADRSVRSPQFGSPPTTETVMTCGAFLG